MNSEYRIFKALQNEFVKGWIAKTIFAILAGIAVGSAVAQLFFCSHTVTGELIGSILLGIIVGTFVGVAQSSQLRDVLRSPKLWIVASIAAWAIAALLFEINWPISRCLTSSNSPSYLPGPLIEAIHRAISILAQQMENMVTGELSYGGVYMIVLFLLAGALTGVMVGLPQGIGQWWVLRKELPRSSTLILVNVLCWAVTYILIMLVVDLVNFSLILTLLLLPVALLAPAAVPALVLVWLQTQKTEVAR